MIILAETGATKSAWRAIDSQGHIKAVTTSGINAAVMSASDIQKTVSSAIGILNPTGEKIEKVHFYGAGILSDELSQYFPGAEVECASDLLAAARAVCDHSAGIAAILGTGSNSCFFDGERIVRNVHSSGFILGDEGSAAVLGKLFLSDYFKELVPEELAGAFGEAFEADYATVVKSVYRSQSPSAYLGSLAPWLLEHAQGSEYLKELVKSNFRSFCSRCLTRYDISRYEVGIVGGFAYAAKDLLLEVTDEFGIRISGIFPDISDRLLKYHMP